MCEFTNYTKCMCWGYQPLTKKGSTSNIQCVCVLWIYHLTKKGRHTSCVLVSPYQERLYTSDIPVCVLGIPTPYQENSTSTSDIPVCWGYQERLYMRLKIYPPPPPSPRGNEIRRSEDCTVRREKWEGR